MDCEPVETLVHGFFGYFSESRDVKACNYGKDLLNLQSCGISTKQEKDRRDANTIPVPKTIVVPPTNMFDTVQSNDKYLDQNMRCLLKIIPETREIR